MGETGGEGIGVRNSKVEHREETPISKGEFLEWEKEETEGNEVIRERGGEIERIRG